MYFSNCINMTVCLLYSNELHTDLIPVEHLMGVVERQIGIMDVQQLCDTIISIWSKVSEECFQHTIHAV